MVFILSGLCGDSPDHGGDQCLQYWSAVTFKISLPHATALLLQTSGFKPRNFFPILWPSCGRSTNLIGSQYGHPPNLLDYALNWEFVELILFPALSSLLLVRLFSSSFHICLPSPQLLFPALLYLFRLELLQACTSSCLLLLLWLWPVQSPDSRFPLGIKNDCKFRWLLDSFSSCASVTNDVLTSTM